jgi:hypothetical protein
MISNPFEERILRCLFFARSHDKEIDLDTRLAAEDILVDSLCVMQVLG